VPSIRAVFIFASSMGAMKFDRNGVPSVVQNIILEKKLADYEYVIFTFEIVLPCHPKVQIYVRAQGCKYTSVGESGCK
jgi:hypothetical protein